MPEIDRSSPIAPWRQIVASLREGIADGTYPSGTPLPSVARLVQEWGVARTTANKVLRQLAADGLAELSPGMGYFVK
jgi:DNA-binding GntR family transcriptional regulator